MEGRDEEGDEGRKKKREVGRAEYRVMEEQIFCAYTSYNDVGAVVLRWQGMCRLAAACLSSMAVTDGLLGRRVAMDARGKNGCP